MTSDQLYSINGSPEESVAQDTAERERENIELWGTRLRCSFFFYSASSSSSSSSSSSCSSSSFGRLISCKGERKPKTNEGGGGGGGPRSVAADVLRS